MKKRLVMTRIVCYSYLVKHSLLYIRYLPGVVSIRSEAYLKDKSVPNQVYEEIRPTRVSFLTAGSIEAGYVRF